MIRHVQIKSFLELITVGESKTARNRGMSSVRAGRELDGGFKLSICRCRIEYTNFNAIENVPAVTTLDDGVINRFSFEITEYNYDGIHAKCKHEWSKKNLRDTTGNRCPFVSQLH